MTEGWIQRLQRAIDYIEAHIKDEIDPEEIARQAYCSAYHFQRVFGMLCGVTLGEYVRRRRLTLAAQDLLTGRKVIEVALDYGYDSPDSFARAFKRFHGVPPSQAKRSPLKIYPRLSVEKGGMGMDFSIQELPPLTLVGYGTRFTGVPFGEERLKQEDAFFQSTRAKQWLLAGAACESVDYCIVSEVGEGGYGFAIACQLDDWTRKNLFNPAVTGVDFMEGMGFETIVLPRRTYAVFRTEKCVHPIAAYTELRRRIATAWSCADYFLEDAPEVVVLHWRGKREDRFVEIRLPVIKK